jgi:uronate dehydrogenase
MVSPSPQGGWSRQPEARMTQKNVLVTGAAGAIGSAIREPLRACGLRLRLADMRPISPAADEEEIVTCDLSDLADATAACEGMDCLVHLAAMPTGMPGRRFSATT